MHACSDCRRWSKRGLEERTAIWTRGWIVDKVCPTHCVSDLYVERGAQHRLIEVWAGNSPASVDPMSIVNTVSPRVLACGANINDRCCRIYWYSGQNLMMSVEISTCRINAIYPQNSQNVRMEPFAIICSLRRTRAWHLS